MAGRTIVAIDPGAKGFVTFMRADGFMEFASLADGAWDGLAERLREVAASGPCMAVVEEVHAIFGSSAKSTFQFGKVAGIIEGMLAALRIPYATVPPKAWQSEVWTNGDKVYETRDGRRRVDTKATSLRAARRLFPGLDLRRTPACRKPDDNKVDSILIAEYARRRNL